MDAPLPPKTVIGLHEQVTINGHPTIAKIDTGASISSIDLELATKLHLGPLVARKVIITAHGKRMRPVIKTPVVIGGRKINASFTIITRSHMKYKVLIGLNVLKKNFLIDPMMPPPPHRAHGEI